MRPTRQPDAAFLDQEVVIGRRDIDVPAPNILPISGVNRGQWAAPTENAGQDAGPTGWDMQDDENGGGQVSGQIRHHLPQRFHAAG